MAAEFFGTSPEIDARKRYALSILQQAADTSPKAGGPLAAAARALTGGIGGYIANQADQEDKAAGAAMFNGLPGLGGAPSAPAGPVASAPTASPADASLPRGLRNNNPLNRGMAFTQGQPGSRRTRMAGLRGSTPDQGKSALVPNWLDIGIRTSRPQHGRQALQKVASAGCAGDGISMSACRDSLRKEARH
jgi:hypothetical protein